MKDWEKMTYSELQAELLRLFPERFGPDKRTPEGRRKELEEMTTEQLVIYSEYCRMNMRQKFDGSVSEYHSYTYDDAMHFFIVPALLRKISSLEAALQSEREEAQHRAWERDSGREGR